MIELDADAVLAQWCHAASTGHEDRPGHGGRLDLDALASLDRVISYRLPLRHRFRRIEVRHGLLIHGPYGWGEVSPFLDYAPHEWRPWVNAALTCACHPAPSRRRDSVAVNATVPVVSPERAHAIVTESGGCTSVKVKVADPRSTLRDDCDRIEAVRDALGSAGQIRVDANAAWTVDEALDAIDALDRAAATGGGGGLEYVEQPCASVEELAEVRRHCSVAIAADESVRRAEDPLAVARAGAADLLVLKSQPLGGWQRIHDIVTQTGLPLVMSSALESSLGLARAVECAASIEHLDFACGLATAQMFTDDVCHPLRPRAGAIHLDDLAASLTPDEERIDQSLMTAPQSWSREAHLLVEGIAHALAEHATTGAGADTRQTIEEGNTQ